MPDETCTLTVLFDGDCELCSRSVQFIESHKAAGRFTYLPLASEQALRLLAENGIHSTPDSVMLLENGVLYVRSTAALRIALRLRMPWRALSALLILPAIMRDPPYRLAAANRHRLFVRKNQCRLPPR